MTRHSSSWALSTVLTMDGKGAVPSDALLFGLGASAWYSWNERSQVLKGLHPDRVVRALLALNITTMCYRHLDEGAFKQLEERRHLERPAIANLGLRSMAGQGAALEDDGDFSVVVVDFEGDAADLDGARVHYLSALEHGTRTCPALEFARSWFAGPDGERLAGWFVPLSVKDVPLQWNTAFSLRRSLWQFSEQMRTNRLGQEITGLGALDRLMDVLQTGTGPLLRPTWSRACLDGGAQFHRDLMAAFLAESADLLDAPELARAALDLSEAGRLWASVFELVEQGCEAPDLLLPLLRRIRRAESSAIDRVTSAAGDSWQ
jgi:hypothetical protein